MITFEKMTQSAKFVKLLTKDMVHNGMTFKEGLNVDSAIWSDGYCSPDGIYFTDTNFVIEWIRYNGKIMYWICDVEIPEGEKFIFFDCSGKYKASRVILTNFRRIYRNDEVFDDINKTNSFIIADPVNNYYVLNPEVKDILVNSYSFVTDPIRVLIYCQLNTESAHTYIAMKNNNHIYLGGKPI